MFILSRDIVTLGTKLKLRWFRLSRCHIWRSSQYCFQLAFVCVWLLFIVAIVDASVGFVSILLIGVYYKVL